MSKGSRKSKVYKYTDRTKRPSVYAYIRSTSKNRVAEVIGINPAHMTCEILSEKEAEQFSFLEMDVLHYPKEVKPSKVTQNLRQQDMDQIASMGLVKSCIGNLNECQINDMELKAKMHDILERLKDFQADLREHFLNEFNS